MTAAVVVPVRSEADVSFPTARLVNALKERGITCYLRPSSSALPQARSIGTCDTLRDHETMLWVDSDMAASADDIIQHMLHLPNEPIITCGLYVVNGGQQGFAAEGVPSPVPTGSFAAIAAGAGCMHITRTALSAAGERMPDVENRPGERSYKPLFLSVLGPSGASGKLRWFGEDYSFCLRARDAGVPTIVDPGFRLGHVRRDGKVIDWANGETTAAKDFRA